MEKVSFILENLIESQSQQWEYANNKVVDLKYAHEGCNVIF